MRTPLALLGALLSLSAVPVSAQVTKLPNVTLEASEIITLWPGKAPGETREIGPERILPNRPRPFDQLENVSVPTLAVFLPPAEKRNGTAVLVIPGGGLERLAIETEGVEVAEWLNGQGIAAFVLKYRVPPRDPQQRWKVGLQDAQRAMGLIRSRAANWQLDPEAIGAIGGSAGGELVVALSAYHADARQYPVVDTADQVSTRPSFSIALYPGGYTDRNGALREDIATRINASTPPTFVAVAYDDSQGIFNASTSLIAALKKANVPSELHVFGAGGHGFGVRESGLPLGEWQDLCLNWLRWQGFLDAAPLRSFTRQFTKARATGAAAPVFSASNRGADLATAFAAQRRIVRETIQQGGAVAGYKGAYTSVAAQAMMGLTHPVHGVLFKAGRIDAGATPSVVKVDGPLVVETELGYVIATDIATKLRVPRQALTTVEAIFPAIELPAATLPTPGGPAPNPLDAVASNVASSRYIKGKSIDPKQLENPDTAKVTLTRDGKVLHEGTGADAKGGQALMLMTLINQIVEQGHVIRRGDIIISGALGRMHAGEKGSYSADFGPLGKIEFKIE